MAALTGFTNEASYEAQPAIALEMQAYDMGRKRLGNYPFSSEEQSGVTRIRLGELFATLVDDVRKGVSAPEISMKLHRTVAQITVDVCGKISKTTGLKQIALSGGVFQNRLLLSLTTAGLRHAGFAVYTHHLVPSNDGGLSLGQAVIANFKKD